MECTTKFTGHLKSQFHTERMFLIGRTYAQITRLAVIANILGIMHLVLGPILLEMAISEPSVRKMPLDGQPSAQAGYVPIVGKRQTHFGNRSGIYTESLRTATQFHVLKLHRLLLLSESQDAVLVAHLGIALLNDEVAGIMQWNRYVEAITYPPLLIGIHTQRTLHTTTRITIGRAERTQSITIRIEPKRCQIRACRHLQFIRLLQTLGECLGQNRHRNQHQKQAGDSHERRVQSSVSVFEMTKSV